MHAVVHIGAPKTGTSSLQRHLYQNSKAYKSKGYLYPLAGRKFGTEEIERHLGVLFTMSDRRTKRGRVMVTMGMRDEKKRAEYAKSFIHDLDKEIADFSPKTVIFSDELLFLLGTRPIVSRLANFLRSRFSKISIYCDLREPTDYVRGLVSQSLKAGACRNIVEQCRLEIRDGIYLNRLNRWAESFSSDEIIVKVANGDTIERFHRQLDIPILGKRQKRKSNTSLSTLGSRILVELNSRYAVGERPQVFRTAFSRKMVGDAFELPKESIKFVQNAFQSEVSQLVERFPFSPQDKATIIESWCKNDETLQPVGESQNSSLSDLEISSVCDVLVELERLQRK